jgi:hypothetical protein
MSVEPTLEDRDKLRRTVGAVLFNVMNFPEPVQARLLGQNMGPLNEKLTNAILDAGFVHLRADMTDTTATVHPVTPSQGTVDVGSVTFTESDGTPILKVTLTRTSGSSYGINLDDFTTYGVRLGSRRR